MCVISRAFTKSVVAANKMIPLCLCLAMHTNTGSRLKKKKVVPGWQLLFDSHTVVQKNPVTIEKYVICIDYICM